MLDVVSDAVFDVSFHDVFIVPFDARSGLALAKVRSKVKGRTMKRESIIVTGV